MRFGISFASHLKALEVLPEAEKLGYDVAWFYDTPVTFFHRPLGNHVFPQYACILCRRWTFYA